MHVTTVCVEVEQSDKAQRIAYHQNLYKKVSLLLVGHVWCLTAIDFWHHAGIGDFHVQTVQYLQLNLYIGSEQMSSSALPLTKYFQILVL